MMDNYATPMLYLTRDEAGDGLYAVWIGEKPKFQNGYWAVPEKHKNTDNCLMLFAVHPSKNPFGSTLEKGTLAIAGFYVIGDDDNTDIGP
jgi:hypothetical protein